MQNGFTKNGLGILGLITALAFSASDAMAQQRGGGGTGRAVGGGGGAGRSSTSGTYPKSTDVGEAIISVNPETRQIIVVSDDETQDQIQNVIQNLDRPKPQVLIKVVFVQVTRGDQLDVGVQGSYTHNPNSTTTGKGSTDFGLTDAAAIAAGGGVYSIVGKDFEATLRALAINGKTEILSRPSILARNNQLATIVVGQEVPLITATRFDTVNGQVNTITYRDIGIILRVTPFISSDGMVEMIVQPEISSLSDQTVSIGGGVNVPVIDTRSADTVVVTPDGQTVAIGGLIGVQKISKVSKIPLLGDIPWLGYAFKRTEKQDVKTELLIFLTPFVIQHPGDLANMTSDEKARLDNIPKAFGQQQLDRFLDPTMKKPAPPVSTPRKAK